MNSIDCPRALRRILNLAYPCADGREMIEFVYYIKRTLLSSVEIKKHQYALMPGLPTRWYTTTLLMAAETIEGTLTESRLRLETT